MPIPLNFPHIIASRCLASKPESAARSSSASVAPFRRCHRGANRGSSASMSANDQTGALRSLHPPANARATRGFVFGKGNAIYAAVSGERGRGSSRAQRDPRSRGCSARLPLARYDGGPVSNVETYVFENGEVTIVALLRDFLPTASPRSRETVVMTLPHPLNGYDLRTGRRLGHTDRLVVELGPVEPLSCRCRKSRSLRLPFSGPRNTRLGGNAEFVIRPDEPTAVDVIHSMLLLRKSACHSQRGLEDGAIRI